VSVFGQEAHGVRVERGRAAIEHASRDVDCAVVVDVMSFST
jgi:2-phosphosulfolactate phosphatase